jgi:signal transduction histidine kinase
MSDPTILEKLKTHAALAGVPDEELQWIAAHGEPFQWRKGETLVKTGERTHHLLVVFKGRTVFYLARAGQRQPAVEWNAPALQGVMPYSRITVALGVAIAEEDVDAWGIDARDFPEMIRDCPHFTTACVHTMLDRSRAFKMYDAQEEKMVSLGKLSAGIAHELNNPASAASRSALQLSDRLTEAKSTVFDLARTGLSRAQYDLLENVCDLALGPAPSNLSPIERAEREDGFSDWLSTHGVEHDLSVELAETALTIDALDRLVTTFDRSQLEAGLRWIVAMHGLRGLAQDVERAASRMHQLISAVKRFTYMDRAATLEPTDISEGLQDTLALARAKAREKSVEISLTTDPQLAWVSAVGGELNQVWLNLVDNALDAVPEGGHVGISAENRNGMVVVAVTDDGPGIPEEIRGQIYDPFFTTKEVGKGAGLGLDLAQRIVNRHHGSIELTTRPGFTQFRVVLPALRAENS